MGGWSVKIYRVSNAARGEVFEVVCGITWGTRYRKSFRDEKRLLYVRRGYLG